MMVTTNKQLIPAPKKASPSDWKMMLDLNILSACVCTQLTIKGLVARGKEDGQVRT